MLPTIKIHKNKAEKQKEKKLLPCFASAESKGGGFMNKISQYVLHNYDPKSY